MITEQEIKAIERDAKINYGDSDNNWYYETGYIEGATKERLKAKALLSALATIMSELSGEPSEENLNAAHIAAADAINAYKLKQ